MVSAKGLDALKAAAKLIATQMKSGTADKPAAGERQTETSLPITAPEQRPVIEKRTLGQAVKTAIDEDPIACRLPYEARRELVHLIFEQLKNS